MAVRGALVALGEGREQQGDLKAQSPVYRLKFDRANSG